VIRIANFTSFGAAVLIAGLLSMAWTGSAAAQRAATPIAAVEAFHAALDAGDDAAAISLLDRELRVFESGFINPDLQSYVNSHLAADKETHSRSEWVLEDRVVGGEGDFQWVLSSYRLERGRFTVDQFVLETALVQRTGDSFRIVHIHWSSR
jgi:hypothetical protein